MAGKKIQVVAQNGWQSQTFSARLHLGMGATQSRIQFLHSAFRGAIQGLDAQRLDQKVGQVVLPGQSTWHRTQSQDDAQQP